MRWIALVLLAVVYGWQLHRMTRIFGSEAALWGQAVDVSPQRPRALLNYGVALAMEGQIDVARVFLRRAQASSTQAPAWDRYIQRIAADDVEALR